MVSDSSQSVVIGAGIVGLATALSLAERDRPPIVLEAEGRVAPHQTGHNSGVIHSGLYYKPGSLKAQTCRAGMAEMFRFCGEEGVPTRRCGKLVVAVRDSELPRLAILEGRGKANGVITRRVVPEEMRELEPEVAGVAGLWIEETGVVDYSEVARAMSRRLVRMGGEVRFSSRVSAIRRDGQQIVVETPTSEVRTSELVNCAGLQSDRIAKLAGVEPGIRIVPFRGEYFKLKADRASLVRGLIYPVPDPALPFLGVHFTRRINGLVEAGPNAVLAFKREGYTWADVSLSDMLELARFPGFWRMARTQWRNAISEMRRSLSRARFLESLQALLPSLKDDDIEPAGSGVRAQAVRPDGALVDDFYIQSAPGMVHVLNAPSPAATASLAIGRAVADMVRPRAATRAQVSVGGVVRNP